MIPQLLRQGRAPQVDGIPAGVQPPVQALQDQPRPAGGGQPLPPVVSPGVDLDLNAAPVHAVGPRPSMEDIAKYADRLMVMNHGEKAFDGTPREVFEHYKELEAMGLAAPQVTYISHALKEYGVPVKEDVTTVEEARDAILKLLGK